MTILLMSTLVLGDAPTASARPKGAQCKPAGRPVELGPQGKVEVMQPVEYQGDTRVVTVDKLAKPANLRLISTNGEALSLGKPPWTVAPSRWLSRGRGVYAIGTGRSLTEGHTDLVLVRWGTDPRPRLTKLATAKEVSSLPRAAIVDEYVAVVWTEPGAGGKSHVKTSFIDLEQLHVSEPRDLGALTAGGTAEISAVDKGFVALWSTPEGLSRASFDRHGKPAGKPATLPWKGASAARAAIACGQSTWIVTDDKDDEVGVFVSGDGGKFSRVAGLAQSGDGSLPVLCVGDDIVVAHRTVSAQMGNVVFWVSTVQAHGKVYARRVKDVQGSADDIRMLQLAESQEGRSAWWAEGTGAHTRLWARPLACK